jgi:hypothetical protein
MMSIVRRSPPQELEMRKTVAAATMAASLTIGGATGVALFTPTFAGAQTDDTTEATDDARPCDAQRHRAQLGERYGGMGLGSGIADAVTDVLGLSAADIRAGLVDGRSLADIAAEQGVDTQALADAIVAEHQERLDAAVEAGRLTEEQAAERADTLAAHAADVIERTHASDGKGPHGMGAGRHAGPGQGMGLGMTPGPGPRS